MLAELGRRFGLDASYNSATDVLREVGHAIPSYSTLFERHNGGQEVTLIEGSFGAKCLLRGSAAVTLSLPDRPYVLACDGSYDWGRDPLVSFSPTLDRDYLSLQKLSPNGLVEISKEDADRLGVLAGRRVKLSSAHGDAVVPVRVRTDLQSGVVLVPYAFRDCVWKVLGAEGVTAVKVEQA